MSKSFYTREVLLDKSNNDGPPKKKLEFLFVLIFVDASKVKILLVFKIPLAIGFGLLKGEFLSTELEVVGIIDDKNAGVVTIVSSSE